MQPADVSVEGISTRFRNQEGFMKCPYCKSEAFNLNTFGCFGELIIFVLCVNCEKTVDRLVPERTKIEDAEDYKETEGQNESYFMNKAEGGTSIEA